MKLSNLIKYLDCPPFARFTILISLCVVPLLGTGCTVQPAAYRGVPDDFTLSVEVANVRSSKETAPLPACNLIVFPDGSLHAANGNPRNFPGQSRMLDQQQMKEIYNLAHAALAEGGASNRAYSTVNGELLTPPMTGNANADAATSKVRIWMRSLGIESSHDWQISDPLPPPTLDALIAKLRSLAYLTPSPSM